jgi:hypothetical protein
MPSLFKAIPGTYVKIATAGGGSGTALISVDNLFDDDTLIVTKFSFAQKARVQYRPTLGGDIYVYPLGNEMGAVQISGIVPFQLCGGDGVGAGFTKLASFFESKKASNVQNIQSPIQITLPGLSNFTSKCYLESLSVSGVDPKNKIFGFDLMFRVAPSGGI